MLRWVAQLLLGTEVRWQAAPWLRAGRRLHAGAWLPLRVNVRRHAASWLPAHVDVRRHAAAWLLLGTELHWQAA